MTDTDLVVRFWDNVMVEMTGFTKDSVCGQCLTTLLPHLTTSPILARFQQVLTTGRLEVLAPLLHLPLIPCPPLTPSRYFEQMQQHLMIAPWRDQTAIVGTIVTVEDVTAQLEQERDLVKLQALGERLDPRVTPVLLEALQDADETVRFHAIEGLGQQQTVEAVEALLSIAESRDFSLSFLALDALSQISLPTIAPRLLPLLHDPLLCTAAANALAQIGDAQVVPTLAQQFNQDKAPILDIAQALVTLHDRYETDLGEGAYIAELTQTAIDSTGIQNILETLNQSCGEDLRVLVTVAGWLKHPCVEQTLVRLLNQPLVNQHIVEILVSHGSSAVDRLLQQLSYASFNSNPDARRLTVETLGRIGDRRAVLPLIDLLETEPELVVYIVTALGQIGDRRAYAPLLRLLSHPLALIRQATVAALNALKYPELPHQIETLLDSTNPHLRESATRILGYFAAPDRESILLAHCHDPNERVRVAAIETIPYLESAAAPLELQRALQDAAPKVRAAAARALGQVESALTRPLLLEALQDQDAWVRYYAVRSIGLQADPGLIAPLVPLAEADTAFTVRLAAIEAIGKLGGKQAVEVLVRLSSAHSTENDIDRAILTALGRTAHPNAIPFLIAALKSADADRCVTAMQALSYQTGTTVVEQLQQIAATDKIPRVFEAAIATLAVLETPTAIAALTELTAQQHCRPACINALSRQPTSQIETIAQGLNHPQLEVRHAIIKVMQRFKHPAASEYLCTALTDVNQAIRLAVVVALTQLGSFHAMRRLTIISQADPDPLIRQVAQSSLSWTNAG